MKSLGIILLIFTAGCVAKDSGTASVKNGAAVYYDGDSREEVTVQDRTWVVAQATAMIYDGTRKNFPFLKDMYPLCANERFQEQRLVGHCSGVLIAPNKVLTAAHCMQNSNSCPNARFVFGAHNTASNLIIYSCSRVLSLDIKMDFAIVELDQAAEGVRPAQIAADFNLREGDQVLSLSYPLGLPLKQDVGVVRDIQSNSNFFKVSVDTFASSSGSPLFNKRGEVVGILSRGADDILEDDIYRVQTRGGCINFNSCKNGSCTGETFLKAALISDKI
ncbi:trypsin-like serine peptidase [Bdellovibrio sp. HCB288]|uniref:trypsin-like serine peptidase n=1 Tax=Bdellovibrio sp. HCB288 TaxID=3394355 RepID=UPI0039B45BD6